MRRPMPKKSLGQHYLVDKVKQKMIAHDFKEVAEAILEVGPGPGAITAHLATLNKPLFVVEKDPRFVDLLKDYMPETSIFLGDALELVWDDFLEEKAIKEKKIWLVSNLPYNVSVPLTLSFFKVPSLCYMTLMFQLEVGQKFLGRKGEMNSLHVLANNFFEIKKLTDVSPRSFSPPPEVDSIVLSFTRRETSEISLEEWKRFESFLRSLFAFRRKQLQSVLKMASIKKEDVEKILEKVKLDGRLRAHDLSYEQVLLLYRAFVEIKNEL